MSAVSKPLTLTFAILLLSSLLVLSVASDVQAVSKPSKPQFSVKFVDNSYDVPPTQTTDQYTGITTTQSGYHVDNRTIIITIKNQPFASYNNASGHKISLCYLIEFKGHFGDDKDWQSFYFNWHIAQSDSEYTIVTRDVNYAAGVQLDFRARAKIGHLYNGYADSMFHPPDWRIYVDAESDWNSQTFTIPDGSTSSHPSQTTNSPQNPTASPDNNQPQIPDQTQPPSFMLHPFFLLWIGTLLFVGVVVAVVMVYAKRHLSRA